jgi:hypothetical protein
VTLNIDLAYTAENKVGDSFTGTITDQTVNPLRTAGAFFVAAKKLKKDGTLDETISFNTYDPEAATTFAFPIPKDGHYQFYGAFFRDYDNGKTYAQYEAAYQDTNNIVYRSIFPTPFSGVAPPNTTYWEPVVNPALLVDNVGTSTESPNLEYQIYNRVIHPNAKTFAGTKAAEAAVNGCSDCQRSEDVLIYEQANVNVDALNNYDFRGQHALGEELARANDELIANAS